MKLFTVKSFKPTKKETCEDFKLDKIYELNCLERQNIWITVNESNVGKRADVIEGMFVLTPRTETHRRK